MATRLYFHAATSALSNLPTTEQSTLTADSGKNADAFTVNRFMDTNIGAAQTSLAITSAAVGTLQTLYYTRFVSEQLKNVSSISANTWTFNCAFQQTVTNARFPTGTAGTMRVVIYVWRPSTQSVLGTIFDGQSPSVTRSFDTTEKSLSTTVSGSAVGSIVNGDVIICELWVVYTQAVSSASTDTVYFDGTTATTANNTAVSNHASFIETPQDLTFGAPNVNLTRSVSVETVSVSDSVTRKKGANRTVSTQSTTVGAGTTTRIKNAIRAVATQTITVSAGSVTRTKAANRTVSTQTVTVGAGTVTRVKGAVRAVATQTITVGAGTTSRLKGAVRAVPLQTVSISESVSRAGAAFKRTVATQTTNISESVTRKKQANRTVSTQTVTVGQSVTRTKAAIRAVALQTVAISDAVVRAGAAFKRAVATQTVAISDSVTRKEGTNRTVTPQTVAVSDSVTRSKRANRTVPTQTVTVTAATVTRVKGAVRAVQVQTVAISDSVTRAGSTFKRVVATQTTIIADFVTRTKGVIRTVPLQTVTVGQTVTRLKKANRSVATQTVTVGESVARQRALTRRVVQNNYSILLNGTTGFINCGSQTNLWSKSKSKFSFSIWIKPGIYNTGAFQNIINHGWQATGSFIFYLSTTTPLLVFAVRETAAQKSCNYLLPANLIGEWVNVVCVFDNTLTGNDLKIYVNGVPSAQVNDILENMGYVGNLLIGTSSGSFQDGRVKDFRWYDNVALTAAQVLAISQDVGDNIPYQYRLPMEEGSGSPVDSIAGLTTTLTNGTWDVEVPPGKFDLVAISDSADRSIGISRTISEPPIVVTGSASRFKAATRTVINSVIVSESVARMKAAKRTVATQTVTVGSGIATRIKGAVRAVPLQSTTVTGTVTRLKAATRIVATQTVAVTGSATRSAAFKRVVNQTVAVFDNVTGLHEGISEFARSVIEPVIAVVDSVTRQFKGVRNVPTQAIAVTDSVNRSAGLVRAVGAPSIALDGINDYVNCGNDATLWSQPLSKFTFSLWMYTKAIAASALVVDHGSNLAGSFVLYNSNQLGTAITFRINNNAAVAINATASSGFINYLNRWAHVLCTYDSTLANSNMKIYIDGVRVGAQPTLTDTINLSFNCIVGGAVNDHNGYVRDFRFWVNQALAAADATKVYQNDPTAPTPSYWLKMTEGSGAPVDSITGTKTATLTNGAAWAKIAELTAVIDSVTRQASKAREVPAETVDVSDSTSRLLGLLRSIIETVTVGGGTATRTKAATRAVPAQNVTVGPGVATRFKGVARTVVNSVTVTGTVIRRKGANRIVATQNVLVNATVTRTKAVLRSINNNVPINDFADRVLSIQRAIVSFLTIGESVTREKAATRIVSDDIPVTDSVTGFKSQIHEFVRAIMEPLIEVSDFVTRRAHLTRTVSETVGGVPVYRPGEIPDTVRAQKVICQFLKANWSIPDPSTIDILWDSWYTGQDDITIQCEEMITTQRPQPTNWQFRQYDGYVNIHIFVREQSGISPERLDKMRAFIDALFSQNPTALASNGIDLVWPYVFAPVRYENDPEYFHLIIRIQLKYVKNWPQNI